MWRDIRKYSAFFRSAVLTGVDAEGYPWSVRCTPVFDDDGQTIRVEPADAALHIAGRANLLFHQHNEQLWDMNVFQILGHLERTPDGWVFRPERLIFGGGISPLGDVKALLHARRTARQYLARRRLPYPRISWERIKSFYS